MAIEYSILILEDNLNRAKAQTKEKWPKPQNPKQEKLLKQAEDNLKNYIQDLELAIKVLEDHNSNHEN